MVSFIVVGVCLLGIPGCEQRAARKSAPAPRTLTVLTPHSERIRDAFETGFWRWYLEQTKVPVRINWIYKGTPQCVEYALEVPDLRAEGAPVQVPDVMFGGGIADHMRLAEQGLTRPIELGDVAADFPAAVGGLPTRSPDHDWFATAVSSFGMLYNAAACGQRQIEPPQTWTDLADPRFFGWVALAHPGRSGSHRECLLLVLEHRGWRAGWGDLMRILGNTRALNARSGDALRQVQNGTSLATVAVNFDAQALAAESDGALEYVDPPAATALTPDVVCALREAPNPDLATAFVRFVLGPEGQALWGVRGEARTPAGTTLYHYPLSPGLYADRGGELAVDRNPLEAGFGVQLDPDEVRPRRTLVAPLVAAAADGDNGVALQRAWKAIIEAGQPADALAALTAPPCGVDEAVAWADQYESGDAAARHELEAEWRSMFAERYAEVLKILGV